MAQGEDLMDFLMKTVFQLFVWIFKVIFKLIWTIVSATFNGVVSLFEKDFSFETIDVELRA